MIHRRLYIERTKNEVVKNSNPNKPGLNFKALHESNCVICGKLVDTSKWKTGPKIVCESKECRKILKDHCRKVREQNDPLKVQQRKDNKKKYNTKNKKPVTLDS